MLEKSYKKMYPYRDITKGTQYAQSLHGTAAEYFHSWLLIMFNIAMYIT
eukprot:UN15901